jgi:CO/xanthine dehydrogenase Mo-binding subunit
MPKFSIVGESVPRIDSSEKVTGRAEFASDVNLPGMLHAKVLRSPFPHAKIVRIDTSKVRRLPGVRCVVTNKDAPQVRTGATTFDMTVMARDVVRYAGEPVAAVAADTLDITEEAIELMAVEYEELSAVFDLDEASRTNPAVVIHPDLASYQSQRTIIDWDRPNVSFQTKIRIGDVEKGFRESHLIVENRFETDQASHCPLEPHCTLVKPEADGGLTVWASRQFVYSLKNQLAALFGIPPAKVRIIRPYVGASFGGKHPNRDEVIIALLALKTGQPVKQVWTREEVISLSVRPSMVIYIRDGVREDGTLAAREMKILVNCGAYDIGASYVTTACSRQLAASYRAPNIKFDSYCVYTNEAPTCMLRSVGNAEACWVNECQMDIIAEKLNIDRVTLRMKNILKEGEPNAYGEIVHSTGQKQCLEKAASFIKLDEKAKREYPWFRGKGIAIGNQYSMAPSVAVAKVKVAEDGGIVVFHSADEIGQGCNTVIAQIAAEEFGISVDKVHVVFSDTSVCPFMGSGSASQRTTYILGNAVLRACRKARQNLFEIVARNLGVNPDQLETKDGEVYVRLAPEKRIKISDLFRGYRQLLPGAYGYYTHEGEITGSGIWEQDFVPANPETGQIPTEEAAKGRRLLSFFSYTAKGVEVAVNVETGQVKVLRVVCVHDVGQPINPKMCEQQAEGGFVNGIGFALKEHWITEKGIVINPNFSDYKIPSFKDIPLRQDLATDLANAPHKDGPYGAKGFGETAMVGAEAAICNAIYDAVGVRIYRQPFTHERILKGLKEIGKEQGR